MVPTSFTTVVTLAVAQREADHMKAADILLLLLLLVLPMVKMIKVKVKILPHLLLLLPMVKVKEVKVKEVKVKVLPPKAERSQKDPTNLLIPSRESS